MAGPPPSLPPRRPTPPRQAYETGELFPGDDSYRGDDSYPGGLDDTRVRGPKILAPQANEWDENRQEVEVVRGSRFGPILLFLLGLLVVAVVALFLAARSVFGSGDDQVTSTEVTDSTGVTDSAAGAEAATGTEPESLVTTTTIAAVVPADQLTVALTENPFLCDGAARPFATLSGADGGEQIIFKSPQSSGILPGTAEADGTLTIRWQCDPEQVGTTWDITATGATSGRSAVFSVAGVDQAGMDQAGATPTPAPAIPGPAELTVLLTESPFVCNGETRPFGQLTGAASNEEIALTSPQATGLRNGQADADGSLTINWNCDPEQAGMTWELTATGVTSGRSVTFVFAGG